MAGQPFDIPLISGKDPQVKEYYLRLITDVYPERVTDPSLIYGDPQLEYLRLVNEGRLSVGDSTIARAIKDRESATFRAMGETFAPVELISAIGDVIVEEGISKGTITIDLVEGNYRLINLTGDATIRVINWPINENFLAYITLVIKSNGYRVTWPSGWMWQTRNAPVLSQGYDLISLSSWDKGTTIFAAVSRNFGPAFRPFRSVIRSYNPSFYLPLDENTGNFIDASGANNSGIRVGAPESVPSLIPSDKTGKAVKIGGENRITQEQSPVAIPLGTLSIGFTVKAKAADNTNARIYYSGGSGSTGAMFGITPASGNPNRLMVQLRDDAGTFVLNGPATNIDVLDDIAHFCVFVQDGANWTWYVDGLVRGSGTVTTVGTTFTNTRHSWGFMNRDTPTGQFTGTLDDVFGFSRVLTAEEIWDAYDAWRGNEA